MTHLVRLKFQLGGGVFEHNENCIFFIGKKKSQSLGSEIMCHCTLMCLLEHLEEIWYYVRVYAAQILKDKNRIWYNNQVSNRQNLTA